PRLPLAVAVKAGNGWRLVGMVDLEIDDTPARSGTVDCWLDARFEGRGLTTRAVSAVLDQAFGPLGLSVVTWFVRLTDQRGRSAARRLGFVQEGVFQQGAFPGEGDEAVFRLRTDGWRGAANRSRTAEPGSCGPSH
ncbi:GNAT family N-acetyltransferase, partial [Nocardiopsis lucentensis]|uniref:GNAT family N-acetyltransferase n=1 Tax=Nocardiopsis lucentensis TaxID=53441 RepID=UPI000375E542